MLSGIFTSLVTPYKSDQDQQIDLLTLNHLVESQLQKGISGFVVLSPNGEGMLLNKDEKLSVIQSVKQTISKSGRLASLIVDCTDFATGNVVQNAFQARMAGADSIIAAAPFCNCSDMAVFNHFITIANSSPLPLIISNDPKRTGRSLNFADIVRLGEHENIIACCEAGESLHLIEKLKYTLSNKLQIFSANDMSALPMMMAGAQAVISQSSNALPQNWITIWNNWTSGKVVEAQKNQTALLGLHEALNIEPGPGSIKALLNLMGMCTSNVRQPFAQPLRPVLYRLAAEIDKLGIAINSGEIS